MAARASTSRSRPFTAAIHELVACSHAAALLDLEGTILFANDAWERFAHTAGGFDATGVGDHLFDAIRGAESRDLMRRMLERIAHGAGGPTCLTVECNEPDLARLITVQLAPVLSGTETIGFTLVQRVVRELPVAEVYPVVEGTADDYRLPGGAIDQCSCCRRTRRVDDAEQWDFVPALVAAPPDDTVYRTCPLCHELHNPLAGEQEH